MALQAVRESLSCEAPLQPRAFDFADQVAERRDIRVNGFRVVPDPVRGYLVRIGSFGNCGAWGETPIEAAATARRVFHADDIASHV